MERVSVVSVYSVTMLCKCSNMTHPRQSLPGQAVAWCFFLGGVDTFCVSLSCSYITVYHGIYLWSPSLWVIIIIYQECNMRWTILLVDLTLSKLFPCSCKFSILAVCMRATALMHTLESNVLHQVVYRSYVLLHCSHVDTPAIPASSMWPT